MDTRKFLSNKHESGLKYKIIMALVSTTLWFVHTAYGSIPPNSISLDPSILYGKLENGLTYYIKPTSEKDNEIELRLLVKAGVVNQDDDQYEMQHIVEHLAFKSGKNMTLAKAHELGFNIGQINGSGSINFTKFTCKVKTVKQREIGFQLLQDIIWNLEIKNEHIDSERSVIINEAMVRNAFGVQSYIIGLENTMLGRGAQSPTDLIKYLKTFHYSPLKRFYKEWYRPDLMALIVVGDIKNINSIEKEIIEKFSKLEKTTNSRQPIINYDTYLNSRPQFIKRTHPYMLKDTKFNNVEIKLYMRQNEQKKRGLEFLRNEQIKNLFMKMLNSRQQLDEEKYGTNFSTFSNYMIPSYLGLKLNLNIEYGSSKLAILRNIQLLNQIKLYGFSHQEFVKSKNEHLISLKKQDTTKTIYWTDAIGNHFISGKPLPQNKMKLLYSIIDDLTFSEFNHIIKEYVKTRAEDFDIIIVAPPKHKILAYSEATIREWITKANNTKLKTYDPPSTPKELLSAITIKSLEKSTIKINPTPIPGATEYRLGNGVRLVLKPTHSNPSNNSKISLSGFQNIGAEHYSKNDYFSAVNSTKIVMNSGVGGLDKYQLNRLLNHRKFNGYIKPYINYDESGILGSVDLGDLEIALQLVYLYFTAPNENYSAFKDWKSNFSSSNALSHIDKNNFYSSIQSFLGDYTLYSNSINILDGTNKTDMNRALSIYKEIFSNARDFTFILTGDFEKTKVLSLCRRYLGNLPVNPDKTMFNLENVKPKQFKPPKTQRLTIQAKRFTPKTEVILAYTSKLTNDWGWREDIKAEILRQLMSRDIMQEIRFNSENPGVYTIGLARNPHNNRPFNSMLIKFSCMPTDIDRLISESKQYIRKFKNIDINMKSFKLVVNDFLKEMEMRKNSNVYVAEKIYDYYSKNSSWSGSEQEKSYLKSISPEDIKKISRQLFENTPYEFIMEPSK